MNRTGNGDKIKENNRKGTGQNIKGKGKEMYRTRSRRHWKGKYEKRTKKLRDSKNIWNPVFEDSMWDML